MSQQLNSQVLDFVEVTGEALETSRKLAEATLANRQKIAAAVPPQVDALCKSKLIAAEEKEAALTKLSLHEGALEVIGNLVRHIQKQAADHVKALSAQGQGVPGGSQKQASVPSTESNYVGRRHGDDDEPESYRRFDQLLGI